MGWLPVSADTYFSDFSCDIAEYSIVRDNAVICVASGLPNSGRNGKYVSFRFGTDVKAGDTLVRGSNRFSVLRTDVEVYRDQNELISAYY
jgi:hypothetical protein